MTTAPFKDCVVIDTNVWIHLLNPQDNVDSHIDKLLDYFRRQRIELIVDDKGRIGKEYRRSVLYRYQGLDESGNERYLLRYCLNAPRRIVSVDTLDNLMKAIEAVIHEPGKDADRTFVYVAFKVGRILVSNDMRDIVRGTASEHPQRRVRLRMTTSDIRPSGADILTSKEAHDTIQR